MTPIRALRMAWAGAIVAGASAFLYLAYTPVPGSYTADRLLTIGVAVLGAVAGAVLETRVENSIRSRRPQAEVIPLPTPAQPAEQPSVRGP